MNNLINKCLSFLETKKDKINAYQPFFLSTYMILLLFPYIFARIEAFDTVFTSGLSQIFYRGLTSLYAAIYLLLTLISNKLKVNKVYLVGGTLLLITFIISCIVSPHTLYRDDGSIYVTIEWWVYLLGSLRVLLTISLFILIISTIHQVMGDIKVLYLSFYILIGVVALACLFTYIYEYRSIIQFMNEGDEHALNIRSIFHSKNEFGLMLLLASLATSFIIYNHSDDLRYLFFYIPLFLFAITSILSGCRTSFISCVILIIYLSFGIFATIKLKKHVLIIVISIAALLLMLLLLYIFLPVLHRPPYDGLFNVIEYTFYKVSYSMEDRIYIWNTVLSYMKGNYLVFGANTTNSVYLLMLNAYHYDFHSGYIKWFAMTGIIGSIIYLTLFIYVFYLIIKLIKKKPFEGVLILIFLLVSMVYATSESTVLFISTSLPTYLINVITIVYVKYLLKNISASNKVLKSSKIISRN